VTRSAQVAQALRRRIAVSYVAVTANHVIEDEPVAL
jgi:hypothetical protein